MESLDKTKTSSLTEGPVFSHLLLFSYPGNATSPWAIPLPVASGAKWQRSPPHLQSQRLQKQTQSTASQEWGEGCLGIRGSHSPFLRVLFRPNTWGRGKGEGNNLPPGDQSERDPPSSSMRQYEKEAPGELRCQVSLAYVQTSRRELILPLSGVSGKPHTMFHSPRT